MAHRERSRSFIRLFQRPQKSHVIFPPGCGVSASAGRGKRTQSKLGRREGRTSHPPKPSSAPDTDPRKPFRIPSQLTTALAILSLHQAASVPRTSSDVLPRPPTTQTCPHAHLIPTSRLALRTGPEQRLPTRATMPASPYAQSLSTRIDSRLQGPMWGSSCPNQASPFSYASASSIQFASACLSSTYNVSTRCASHT